MLTAQESYEFAVNDLYECLTGCEALSDFFANRAFADTIDERFDDRQRDIGFEQRKPDLPQRVLDIRLTEASLACEITRGFAQALG
jgi:hypothetical protein